MRIVHFSDIHAGGWVRSWRGYLDKRLLGACNYCLRRRWRQRWGMVATAAQRILSLRPDLVVCTGDIASISEPAEFAMAREALEPLVADARCRFIYVPGNHDRYVSDPVCLSAFEETFRVLNQGLCEASELPLLMEVGGVPVVLLNEAVPRGPLASSGAVSAEHAARVLTLLDDAGGPVVLAHHFPFFDAAGAYLSPRRRCYGPPRFGTDGGGIVDAFRGGRIAISLCGHIHVPFARTGPGAGVEYCAGSLTHRAMLNVVDWCRDDGRHTQTWIDLDRPRDGEQA